MSRVLTVAWRDFKATVLRKVFLIAVIGIPMLIVGVMAIAVLMMVTHEEPPLVGTVGIVDPTGDVAREVQMRFETEQLDRDTQNEIRQIVEEAQGHPGRFGTPPALSRGDIRLTVEPHEDNNEATLDGLRQRVSDGSLLAIAIITEAVLERPDPDADRSEKARFDLIVAEHLDKDHTTLLERRVGQAIVRVRAARANLDPDETIALLERPLSDTKRLMAGNIETSESRGARELQQMIPMIFMMLIWVATFTAGQHLMMSTIEEKSNRVIEVLLSAVSPLQLMTGKIIGQGCVGLLLLLIYGSLGIASLVVFAAFHLIDLIDLVYLVVFFIMAFFMVASIMAAVGRAVSDVREANTLVTPVMLVLMVPLMLWMPITQAPNGVVALVCSFVPPAIPFAMILRLAADEAVPLWQIPVTIVWGYACMLGMVWMAAKIFRVGVLMYGKPPSPIELLRWVRYA